MGKADDCTNSGTEIYESQKVRGLIEDILIYAVDAKNDSRVIN